MAGQAGVGKAVERLEEQLAEESSAPPGLRLTLAELYIQQGRVSKADGVLQPLEGSDALPAAVDLVWGRVELAKGDWPLAADRLEAYTKKHPGHAYGHYLLARSYAQAGRQGEAQAALERALKADPGAEAARLTLARIALRKGQLEEAQSHVERLSRLKSPDVYDLMARLAAERGDFQEAVSVYQEARANYPHDLNLALGHAQALALKGSPESGLNLMQDWVADHPDDLGGRHALAQIYLSLGKREQARETYQAIVEARGRDPVALNNLAMLLKEHNPDQALIYAQRAYEAAPESLTVIDTMAGLLIEQGDFQRALQVLETAQKSNGSRQTIQLLQAKALLGLGRRDQARGLLQQVAKDPDYKERAEALLP
jgi:predicted Zn-dependent protease